MNICKKNDFIFDCPVWLFHSTRIDPTQVSFSQCIEPSAQHRTSASFQFNQVKALRQSQLPVQKIPSTNRICVLENILIRPGSQKLPETDNLHCSMKSKRRILS